MTILVYCNKTRTTYVDSGYTWTNGTKSRVGSKVMKTQHHDQIVVSASSGPTATGDYLLRRALAAIDDQSFVVDCEIHLLHGSTVIFSYNEKLWFVEAVAESGNSKTAVVDLNTCGFEVVAGSGGIFFAAYFAMTDDVQRSVELTAIHHAACAMPLEGFTATRSFVLQQE